MTSFSDLDTLPGADLVRQGAEDLDEGHESAAALLVSIGAPRLRRITPRPSGLAIESAKTPADGGPGLAATGRTGHGRADECALDLMEVAKRS
jgi:hypothetical protein